jgi:hypothetical protein
VNRVTVAKWETSAAPPGPVAARLLVLAELHAYTVKRRLRAFSVAQAAMLDRLAETFPEGRGTADLPTG